MKAIRILFVTMFACALLAGLLAGTPADAKPVSAVADITEPVGGQYLGDATEVRGIATCLRFSYWSLSYREQGELGWIELTRSYTAVSKNALLYTWNTTALEEGWYELRLAVYSSRGLQAEEIVSVNMTYVPCGDFTGDFIVDMEDVEGFAEWIFEGGPPPFQMRAMDVNLDGSVDILDLDYLTQYVVDPENNPAPCAWTIGDLNHDFWVNEEDVEVLVAYMFEGGPAPMPMESADVDCSTQVNIADLDYLTGYVYRGGPEPGLDCYLRGDFNHVTGVNIDDVYYMTRWMFKGGPQPMPRISADTDCSGDVNILDLDRLINVIPLPEGEEVPCP